MNIYRVPQSTLPGIRQYNDYSFNINKLYTCNVNVLLTIHNRIVLKEQNKLFFSEPRGMFLACSKYFGKFQAERSIY